MMKHRLRRFSIILTLLFLASHALFVDDALAKRRSRSFSSRSRKRPKSYTSKKSPKGSFFSSSTAKKKKSYTSRSKTKNKKGSVFNSKAKKTTRGTSLAQATQKANSKSKFMSSVEGKPVSKTYREVVTENPSLGDSLTVENMKTRGKRRDAFYKSYKPVNTYYRYPPTVVYSDPYHDFFFRYVTITWLFHHWDNVDKRRFDEAQLRELETKIEQMEEEGMVRDPNYVMPEADSDLQYSEEELENLQEAKDVIDLEAEQESDGGGFGWLTIFLASILIVGGVYFVAVRRY